MPQKKVEYVNMDCHPITGFKLRQGDSSTRYVYPTKKYSENARMKAKVNKIKKAMQKATAVIILLISANCFSQGFKPIGSISGGMGSFGPQLAIDLGAEYERAIGHFDVTWYAQNVFSFTAKAGIKAIYFDVDENSFLSLHAGWSRYSISDELGKTSRQHPYLSLRWTHYRGVSDIGFKNGGIFFTVGVQLRKINR